MPLNRRKFLNRGLLVAGIPFLGSPAIGPSHQPRTGAESFYLRNNITPRPYQTYFISHRGVHLKQRIAAENTLESLLLAKRVGFQCVEFDLRFTKDQKPVVMHDETVNRTLRDLNGNTLDTPIYVKDLTFEQLRSQYLVYTENKKARTIVPSFVEYLNACNLHKVIPFIEIKEHQLTEKQYHYVLNLLDSIIGRENYVITSNNKVNDKLRQLGYHNVMVMGILYQTTFEHIQSWKHSIMAISASRFTPAQMHVHVLEANRCGILSESHADTIDKYSTVIKNGIDFLSTDALMPEQTGYGQIIEQLDLDNDNIKSLSTNGALFDAEIRLQPGEYLEINITDYKHLYLYGVTFEMEFAGTCTYHLHQKEVVLQQKDKGYFRHPVLLHKEEFTLKINAIETCSITGLRLTITRF